jgi:2,3-bisphosphoglycerate-independent phosphoglycerate mutase
MNINPQKVVLIIMDGWGEASPGPANAISKAHTPFVDSLYKNYPHSLLKTSGKNVGLPDGQMGNSEVGHLNIGAGRIVYQDLLLIDKAIKEKTIDTNKTILDTFRYCTENNKPLHLIGLASDGGVHSHLNHLIYLCELANNNNIRNIFIHAFTDGRDTDPHSGLKCLKIIEEKTKHTGARIASVIGRYYAMDRDNRWERIKKSYDLMVHGKGAAFGSAEEAVNNAYDHGITDEFIEPSVIVKEGTPVAHVAEGDAVICFNFRTDRCREITRVLTQSDYPDYNMFKLKLNYVTMTNYDSSFKNVGIIFRKPDINNTLGEILAKAGKSQLRISETEKYPHVTFFFSGGREEKFIHENRIMVPSPKVATYDLQPSMSAYEVKDKLVAVLHKGVTDFVCLNFANSDMVGHTGNFKAAVEALETVDKCVQEVVEAGLEKDYSFIITSDHGNVDLMINPDGTPNTAHTTNPVPCFLVSGKNPAIKLNDGRLADIAPTILTLMGLEVPRDMTGTVLLEEKI